VHLNSGDESPRLTVLESVRCLECGAVYAKPSGGGTVRENPGCPECGYVGWMNITRAFTERASPSRSVADRLPHHSG
jgi:predicted  nucleic acid-binding Zn-ribbon protein